MSKGKFIVIYGPNNIGKTTQVKLLAQQMITTERQLLTLKYPIYPLKPTGPKINEILRSKDREQFKDLKETDIQKLFAQNRRDFQATLQKVLQAGINVLAEDYLGTGIAWGMTRGVSLKALEKINSGLLKPDISILMDGERFLSKVESTHINEGLVADLWGKNREIHLQLAEKYNWIKVNANREIAKVQQDIWQIVSEKL